MKREHTRQLSAYPGRYDFDLTPEQQVTAANVYMGVVGHIEEAAKRDIELKEAEQKRLLAQLATIEVQLKEVRAEEYRTRDMQRQFNLPTGLRHDLERIPPSILAELPADFNPESEFVIDHMLVQWWAKNTIASLTELYSGLDVDVDPKHFRSFNLSHAPVVAYVADKPLPIPEVFKWGELWEHLQWQHYGRPNHDGNWLHGGGTLYETLAEMNANTYGLLAYLIGGDERPSIDDKGGTRTLLTGEYKSDKAVGVAYSRYDVSRFNSTVAEREEFSVDQLPENVGIRPIILRSKSDILNNYSARHSALAE